MSYAVKTEVQTKIVTASTAQVTLCQFDLTALPGVGQSLTPPYVIEATIRILLTANPMPDHSSRVWRQVVCWERTGSGTGASFRVLGGPANDDANGGNFGAATTGNPTYDVSGNFGRVRMIPYDAASLTWFTRMDLTVLQG
jgi:hypothetical protein